MKKAVVKIGNKNILFKQYQKYSLEYTLINKITPILNPEHQYIDGYINYKGKVIYVYDISSEYDEEPLLKFDGTIFITNDDENIIGIKFEGFPKQQADYDYEFDYRSLFQLYE